MSSHGRSCAILSSTCHQHRDQRGSIICKSLASLPRDGAQLLPQRWPADLVSRRRRQESMRPMYPRFVERGGGADLREAHRVIIIVHGVTVYYQP